VLTRVFVPKAVVVAVEVAIVVVVVAAAAAAAAVVVEITQWNLVLLEKLTVTQLVKKFPAFYGAQKLISVFTRARSSSSRMEKIP